MKFSWPVTKKSTSSKDSGINPAITLEYATWRKLDPKIAEQELKDINEAIDQLR